MQRHNPLVAMSVAIILVTSGCMGQAGYEGHEQIEQEAEVCPPPGGTLLEGIDVSYWQPDINWAAVAGDGIVFAFIRVSDGDPSNGGTYDTEFQTNWAAALQNGILRGPYQFFRPNHDPIAQADLVISEIGGAMTPGDLPPVIDMEATGGLTPTQVAAAMGQWINRIETQLGVTPIIYTGKYFWQDNVQSSAYSSYPLWHAQYTSATCPNIADQWSAWAFWQYTSSGSVAGISGNCDRNVFNGDLAALQSMTFGDPVCGDGYCTGDEDHASCPQDCPICENIPPLGRIVDDTDLCFEPLGTASYWRHEAAGWDSTLLWTHTVAMNEGMDNHAIWTLNFDEAGQYRLEAYTDATFAESVQAIYQVRHQSTTENSVVDQTAVDGWNLVGDYQFAQGSDQWVRLEDQTGEALSTNTQIVFDAIRVTRLDPGPDGGVIQPDGTVPQTDAGDVPGADGGDPGGDAGTDPGGESGCGCRQGAGPAPPLSLLLILGFLALLRRRRRPS